MHANQEMFTAEMQELFGILQSNNIFNHSNSLKKKKSCDHLNWYRENWKQFNNHTEENIYALWIDGKLSQLHKEDLKISTVHFAFNGEKWTAVLQSLRTRQRCPLSLPLGILAGATKQGRKIIDVQMRME